MVGEELREERGRAALQLAQEGQQKTPFTGQTLPNATTALLGLGTTCSPACPLPSGMSWPGVSQHLGIPSSSRVGMAAGYNKWIGKASLGAKGPFWRGGEEKKFKKEKRKGKDETTV